MTALDELAGKFSSALTVQDVFGSDVDTSYRQLAAICHPDKWHGTPDADRAQELFKLLVMWGFAHKVLFAHKVGRLPKKST